MADTLPLVKNTNLDAPRTNHRDPREIDDGDARFPIHLLILMPNAIGSFVRACRGDDDDYFLPVSILMLFMTILLSKCSSRYKKLPNNEKSSRKYLLKLSIWFLCSALLIGFVYLFTCLSPSQIPVVLYTGVVIQVCGVFALYVFIIVDFINDWKIRSSSEDEIGVFDNQTAVAGKYNY